MAGHQVDDGAAYDHKVAANAHVENASNAYVAGVLVKEHSAPKRAIQVVDWLHMITKLLQNHTCEG